jgi:hypothetical protein
MLGERSLTSRARSLSCGGIDVRQSMWITILHTLKQARFQVLCSHPKLQIIISRVNALSQIPRAQSKLQADAREERALRPLSLIPERTRLSSIFAGFSLVHRPDGLPNNSVKILPSSPSAGFLQSYPPGSVPGVRSKVSSPNERHPQLH